MVTCNTQWTMPGLIKDGKRLWFVLEVGIGYTLPDFRHIEYHSPDRYDIRFLWHFRDLFVNIMLTICLWLDDSQREGRKGGETVKAYGLFWKPTNGKLFKVTLQYYRAAITQFIFLNSRGCRLTCVTLRMRMLRVHSTEQETNISETDTQRIASFFENWKAIKLYKSWFYYQRQAFHCSFFQEPWWFEEITVYSWPFLESSVYMLRSNQICPKDNATPATQNNSCNEHVRELRPLPTWTNTGIWYEQQKNCCSFATSWVHAESWI